MPRLRKNPMQGVSIDAMETFTFIQKAGKQALAQQQLAMQRAEEAINGPAQRAKRERAQAKVNESVRKYAHVPAMTMQQRMMQGLGMEPTNPPGRPSPHSTTRMTPRTPGATPCGATSCA